MSSQLLDNPAIRKLIPQISVQKYHSLYEHGLIPEKTELLEGVIIEKMSKDPIHSGTVNKIFRYFFNLLPEPLHVRKEDPITIFNSEPEPDISIVDFREDAYSTAHPTWAHLVIEVSNTSLALDREKARIYAQGKIPEYWIVNLNDMNIEVYRDPDGDEYKIKNIYSKKDVVTALFSNKVRFRLGDFV